MPLDEWPRDYCERRIRQSKADLFLRISLSLILPYRVELVRKNKVEHMCHIPLVTTHSDTLPKVHLVEAKESSHQQEDNQMLACPLLHYFYARIRLYDNTISMLRVIVEGSQLYTYSLLPVTFIS